jgi:hypothetical protein
LAQLLFFLILNFCSLIACSVIIPNFNALAFYTAKNDAAHMSVVNEANAWFAEMAGEYGFTYRATDNWDWYQNRFLGCGAYVSNTWRPTSAILRVGNSKYL